MPDSAVLTKHFFCLPHLQPSPTNPRYVGMSHVPAFFLSLFLFLENAGHGIFFSMIVSLAMTHDFSPATSQPSLDELASQELFLLLIFTSFEILCRRTLPLPHYETGQRNFTNCKPPFIANRAILVISRVKVGHLFFAFHLQII